LKTLGQIGPRAIREGVIPDTFFNDLMRLINTPRVVPEKDWKAYE
jgi:hypothetical protein